MLGEQLIVRGLEKGLQFMYKGETAELVLRSEYAYGEDGRLLGFGHGVALAAYLVHMNGGSFWFRDEPHGQTCSFVFPAEAPESEAPESDGDAGARPDTLADQ